LNTKNREGLAKGLSESNIFFKELENHIVEWYVKESDNILISEYLENYMEKHKGQSRGFRKQIECVSEINNKKTLKELIIRKFFDKKIKCKHFYNVRSRTVDLTGLQADVPQKFNFGFGSFKIETKYYDISERLQALDVLQYSLSNDINGISDQNQKDSMLKKIIETKIQMLQIIMQLNNRD